MHTLIDELSLSTDTREDPFLLLREVFAVRQDNHLPIKLKECKLMKQAMEYLGFDLRYS